MKSREEGWARMLWKIFSTLLRYVNEDSSVDNYGVKNRIENWFQAKYDQLFCHRVENEDEWRAIFHILNDDLQLRSELRLPMRDNFEQFSQLLLSGNLVNDQFKNYVSCIQYYEWPTDISSSSFLVITFYLKLIEGSQMARRDELSQTAIAIARYFDRYKHQLSDLPDHMWSRIQHFFEEQTRQFIWDISHGEDNKIRRTRCMFLVVIPNCIRVSKIRQGLSEWALQLVDSSIQATKQFFDGTRQHRLDKLMLPRKSLAKYIADMINSLEAHKGERVFGTEVLTVFLNAMLELIEELLVNGEEESRTICWVDWNFVNKMSGRTGAQGNIGLFYLSLARINLSLRPHIDVGYRNEANRSRREFMAFVESRFQNELLSSSSSDRRFQMWGLRTLSNTVLIYDLSSHHL